MENSIQIFKNNKFGEVRVTEINGEPMFCLSDICKILELDPSAVMRRLDNGVISNHPLQTAGGVQRANFVNEDGFYDAILDSRKPEAKQFRKWVTSEILPSIRKHGGYLTPQKIEEVLLNPDTLIKLANNLKAEQQRNKQLSQDNERMRPKELFADAVATSDRSCLIAELAKILQQNGIDIGQNRLFIWLRDNGYLCSKGEYYNQPTQRAMEMGLFELKKTTITKPDGSVLTTTTTKVSGKGQIYFVNKFLAAA